MLRFLTSFLFVLLLFMVSCGGNGNHDLITGDQSQVSAGGWPNALPNDKLQPWENGVRNTGALNTQSEFVCGAQFSFNSSTGVSELGDAACLESGAAGSGTLVWATYRVLLEGAQPGVVSLDVNPCDAAGGGLSSYYVGVSDYGAGCWEWYGPFSDNHVRLSTGAAVAAGADYLSGVGNLFVCVVAYDGVVLDVVGVGANPVDGADSAAPPVPQGTYATAVSGGLEVCWDDVIAGDLAGYRLYYGDAEFSAADDPGVRCLDYLLGQGRHILAGLTGEVYARVSAVDISGNESDLSQSVHTTALGGSGPDLRVTASAASGLLNDAITLTAVGATSYDWDLDGDGVYDVAGDTTGTQPAATGRTGVIRPAVRGNTGESTCVTCGAVSLLISGNSRPAASALAAPQRGDAPLVVTFTGEAADQEDATEELTIAWDFDGDGYYEANTDTLAPDPQTYTVPGTYNAKLRVMDTAWAWDVDTVAITVGGSDPGNQAPVADLNATPQSGDLPLPVVLDASGSTDGDGSIVNYEWDFDGDGVYDGYGGDAVNHTYTDAGVYTARVRVTDDDGDRDTGTVEITVNVPGNLPPAADLVATPDEGLTPFTVAFDATGSADTDGMIVRYDWDFDGDGLYEVYDGGDSPSREYSEHGSCTARVRVTDDAGAQDTATAGVSALTCEIVTADSEGDVGRATSLALVNGNPAICYNDNTTDHLSYVRALDADGRTWGNSVELAYCEFGSIYTSLIVADGNPAVFYYDNYDMDLYYVRATDTNGSAWGTPVLLDSMANTGDYLSGAIVAGNPAVSFMRIGNDDLMYLRATDAAGSAWGSLVSPESAGYVGAGSSLAIVAGCPAISYCDAGNLYLKYIRATDATGSAWGTSVVVVTLSYYGEDTSLAVVNGNPAIGYYDPGDQDVRYVRATDTTGTTWGSPVTVDATGDVGEYPCLTVVDGRPAISYYDDTNDDLKFAWASDADGTAWDTPIVVDSQDSVGMYTSLKVINGWPTITYYNATEDDLNYLRLYY